jgi:hypothetical protein
MRPGRGFFLDAWENAVMDHATAVVTGNTLAAGVSIPLSLRQQLLNLNVIA